MFKSYRLPRLRTLDSLVAYRDYRFLWIGNCFANSAEWFQLLTVGWLVRDLTAGSPNSALLVATVAGISQVPVAFVGPWGGVLGDRIDRRKLIIAVQVLMACFAFLFALLVHSDWDRVWHAYAYVVIAGTCLSITHPMRQALIANTVPREALGNAYAANVISITGTRLIGPLFGGILITSLGFSWAFTVESLFYAGTALALLPMKTPYAERTAGASSESPLANLKEGLMFVWRGERTIFSLILLGLIAELILHPVWYLLPVFTAEVLERGADVGGYLLSATGLGGLMSAFLIASFGFIFKRGPVCLGALVMGSIAAILFAQSQWLVAAAIVIGLMAFSQSAFRTASGTLIQTLTPDPLRARVTSLQAYSRGFVVLSSLLIGWLAGSTSVPFAITAMGLVGLGLGLFALLTLKRVRQLA